MRRLFLYLSLVGTCILDALALSACSSKNTPMSPDSVQTHLDAKVGQTLMFRNAFSDKISPSAHITHYTTSNTAIAVILSQDINLAPGQDALWPAGFHRAGEILFVYPGRTNVCGEVESVKHCIDVDVH